MDDVEAWNCYRNKIKVTSKEIKTKKIYSTQLVVVNEIIDLLIRSDALLIGSDNDEIGGNVAGATTPLQHQSFCCAALEKKIK